MTRPLTTVDINTDTFETLINKTNDLVSVVNSAAVTVNTGGGDITSGNAFVNGFFGANTLVTTNIRAGNVSSTGALLTIQTNSSFLDSTIHVGNSTVNVVALKTGLIIANSTDSLAANLNGLYVSNTATNTVITSQLVSIANSTSSANLNSGGLVSGVVVINSTAIAVDSVSVVNSSVIRVGSNVSLTTSVLNVGNSTVNTVVNSSVITTANIVSNNISAQNILVGANVSLNTTAISVGNSTVNVAINSTSFSGTSANSTRLNGELGSFYTNATNISSGTLNNARLNTANTSQAGIVQLVDSTTNTSVTHAATANSIKTLADSINSISGNNSAANASNIITGTLNTERLPATINVATAVNIGNSTTGTFANTTAVRIANSTSSITIRVPTTTEANGSYYLNGNGSWVVVTSGNTGISSPGGANTEVQFNDSGTLAGNSNFTYNNTTRTITVGNTVVSNNVTTNNVIIQNNLTTAINFTTSGTSQQTVDQIALATYRSTEYLVSIKDNAANGYQVSKMLVIHDGSTSYITEYGTMTTNTSLGVFASDISGANVRLLFTPTSSNTTIRLVRTSIVV